MVRLSDTAQISPLPQDDFQILDITAEPLIRERLLEMGLAPGRTLQLVKRLPFGGPVIVQAGSLSLALRAEEAAHIWLADRLSVAAGKVGAL